MIEDTPDDKSKQAKMFDDKSFDGEEPEPSEIKKETDDEEPKLSEFEERFEKQVEKYKKKYPNLKRIMIRTVLKRRRIGESFLEAYERIRNEDRKDKHPYQKNS